jgi:hypothetical protein
VQSIVNQTNNEYPSFRDISTKIARYRQIGFNTDPNIYLLKKIRGMNIDDVVGFHEEHIKNFNTVYIIVGNSLKINKSKLSSFGDIVYVHKNDFCK